MRRYPQNSPEAIARIVTLAMMADGHACRTEIERVDCAHAQQDFGISREQLLAVTRGFCEDLGACSRLSWVEACRVDAGTVAALLLEIDDPALRVRLHRLCVAVIQADRHVADSESWLLGLMTRQWGLPGAPLAHAA